MGGKRRITLEKRVRKMLLRHNVRLISFEESAYFGNIVLVVASLRAQFRFVRDRGCNSFEVCVDADHGIWKVDSLSESPVYGKISDFCDYVEVILNAKNL